MAIFDLYSKRQKRLRGEMPDVYTYDVIPDALRVQVVHILWDCLGGKDSHLSPNERSAYTFIAEVLRREYCVFGLPGSGNSNVNSMGEVINFFLKEEDTAKVLDVIELSFRFADEYARSFSYRALHDSSEIVDSSIEELNARFREHGVGFQFESGEIIRVDSQFIHAESVKPALTLLNGKDYAGAQEEFLAAFDHYRHGKHKEALNDALKSFESTLKTICTKKRWKYDPKATSKKLIDVCCTNGLIPSFWQQHMGALRSLLEGGVPTGRNRLSGHGQGSTPTKVPAHMVSYVLHMTAAAIVFLVKAEQDMK